MTCGHEAPPTIPESDHRWAHETVRDVSRTFAITIDVLREPMSTYVCVGYLLCRIADTIEDDPRLPPEAKVALLHRYDRVLSPTDEFDVEAFEAAVEPYLPAELDADWTVVAGADRVVGTFDRLPADVRGRLLPPTRELVQGMAMFVDRHAEHGGLRVRTVSELEEYCHYVAGTVGQQVTNLLVREVETADRRRRLRGTAEGYGQLLQLVNIAKDVRVDFAHENNVYLPAEWLEAHDLVPEDVSDPARAHAVGAVVSRAVDHARGHLDDAQSYLETVAAIDHNHFLAWVIPFLLAVATLRELDTRPEDVVSERGVKIPREEVVAIVERVTAGLPPDELADVRAALQDGGFE